jgi:hypothetical protein
VSDKKEEGKARRSMSTSCRGRRVRDAPKQCQNLTGDVVLNSQRVVMICTKPSRRQSETSESTERVGQLRKEEEGEKELK